MDKKFNIFFVNIVIVEIGDFLQGIFNKKIGDEVVYVLNFLKEGYLLKIVEFKIVIK